MKTTGRTVQRVLGFCNRIREQKGLKPLSEMPSGVVGSQSRCPIAVAIDGMAYYGEVHWNGHVELEPKYVKDFIEAFDERRIPELIAE